MGIFSNNSPEEFKDKDAKAIVNMNPSDIDVDFFTKYKDNEIMKGFSQDQREAIQFLIDLKGDKYELFLRMGKKSTPAPANKGTTKAHAHVPAPAPAVVPEKINKSPSLQLKIPPTPRTAIPLDEINEIKNGGGRYKKKKGGKKTQKALIKKKIKTAKK